MEQQCRLDKLNKKSKDPYQEQPNFNVYQQEDQDHIQNQLIKQEQCYYPRKYRKLTQQSDDQKVSGRWTKEEHQQFIQGLLVHGKNWKKIEEMIGGTRSGAQVRSHAQKFFSKLEKEHQKQQSQGRLQPLTAKLIEIGLGHSQQAKLQKSNRQSIDLYEVESLNKDKECEKISIAKRRKDSLLSQFSIDNLDDESDIISEQKQITENEQQQIKQLGENEMLANYVSQQVRYKQDQILIKQQQLNQIQKNIQFNNYFENEMNLLKQKLNVLENQQNSNTSQLSQEQINEINTKLQQFNQMKKFLQAYDNYKQSAISNVLQNEKHQQQLNQDQVESSEQEIRPKIQIIQQQQNKNIQEKKNIEPGSPRQKHFFPKLSDLVNYGSSSIGVKSRSRSKSNERRERGESFQIFNPDSNNFQSEQENKLKKFRKLSYEKTQYQLQQEQNKKIKKEIQEIKIN